MASQLDLLHENPAPVVMRGYQDKAVEGVISTLHLNPILAAPTGSGKTVMGCEIVRRLRARALWLAHRQELIEQAARGIEAACHERPGIIKAGYRPDPSADIQVASVQSLIRRDLPDADLIVIDECHHASAESYKQIIDAYKGKPIVGLTATPFRLDGCGLGNAGFGHIVVAATTYELVEQGWLHAPKVYAGRAPDLRGVRKVGGDYQLSALAQRVMDGGLVGDVVQTWTDKTPGRRTVAFAVDIEHSKAIVDAFRKAGVPAEHVDGTMSMFDRKAVLDRLATGRTTVVSNCMVLTEGWDLPALEVASIARPTASLNLHLQMLGRIMRACEGKDGAVVLDHAGNHHVHGMVTRRIEYSLEGRIAGESEPLGMRRCAECSLLYDTHLDACPECGTVPTPQERSRTMKHAPGELAEYVEDYAYKAEVYRLLVATAEAAAFKPGYAAAKFKERFGDWPVVAFNELVDTDNATQDQKRDVFRQLAEKARELGLKPGWASYRYKDIFGVWPTGFVTDVRLQVGVSEADKVGIRQQWARLTGAAPAAPQTAPQTEDDYDEDEDLF